VAALAADPELLTLSGQALLVDDVAARYSIDVCT
jgi:hypothetical protein